MTIVLASKPGLSSTTTLSIPTTWDATWFRSLITNQLKGADVRNAIAGPGISITGNISSPYATISIGGVGPVTLPGPVTVTAPTSGIALTVDGAPGSYAEVIQGSLTSGQSFGLHILAGTTSADDALLINNAAGTLVFAQIEGNGAGTLGPSATTGISWDAAGEVIIRQGTASTNICLQIRPNTSAAVGLSLLDPGANATQFRINTTNSVINLQSAGGTADINIVQGVSNVLHIPGGTTGATFTGSLSMNGNAPYAGSAGWGTPTGTGVVTNFPGATATLAQCSEVIATLIAILKNFGLMQT